MQFGVCCGPEIARVAKVLGYDYFEWSVVDLLQPRAGEDSFKDALASAKQARLPFPNANILILPGMKIVGPAVDQESLREYILTALRRARVAGISIIGFGSGSARSVPDGFDPLAGWQQMRDFCAWLAEAARAHEVTIALEPLNRGETNLINTAQEAARLIREINHPHLRMVIDGYHWALDLNSPEGIRENADLIVHAHVASAAGRRAPSMADPCAPFFDALRSIGYGGRLSFEGNLADPTADLAQALEVMRGQTSQPIEGG
jgi:sugar phosphate isomerase/epimerase